MKKKKIELLSWKTIPQDLQSYFLLRFIGAVFGIVLLFIAGLIFHLLHLFCYLIYVLLGYVAYELFLYYRVLSNRYLVYEGECEEKHAPAYVARIGAVQLNKNPVYGKSYLYVRINGELFKVPAGNSFRAAKGDRILFYANPDEIYRGNDNTWTVESCLSIRALKQ